MPPSSIPLVGLGTFRLKGEAVQQPLRDALKIGYRHIDTAAIYKNENSIGNVLQEIYAEPGTNISRSDLWLTSKLSPYDMKNPRAALLKSLAALQVDYLDLYLIHWPALARKPASSPQNKKLRIEAWNVLNEAKREGLVRHTGFSNFTPQHIRELKEETECGIDGAFVQMEIHPWYWRDALEIQNCFADQGIVMVGYALLAEGKLLGEDCPKLLDEIAEITGLNKVQIVLAWALSKNWGVLVRSTDVNHLRGNLLAPSLTDVLTTKDIVDIDSITSAGKEEKQCWDPRLVK